MRKSMLYLIGFIFIVLLVVGNGAALTIFFTGILLLCIFNALNNRKQEKKKS